MKFADGSWRRRLATTALYLYVVLLVCPIRYWPLGLDIDASWRNALNFAHAHGLALGRDIIFTYGPLSYLLFPENIGGNLLQGLAFQSGLWILLAVILADVFFRGHFLLRNLAVCSACLGLAAPLFWFNYAGAENLMLAGALFLVVMFRLHGSWPRYLMALVLVGLLPLFKLTAGMVGAAALSGFVVERAIEQRWKVLPLAVLTATVPLAISVSICLAALPSPAACWQYLRGSSELTDGFSAAMSVQGPFLDFIFALEALAVLLLFLRFQAADSPALARFSALLLAIPLFVSFKHGFVRQDVHVVNFFCFVAFALSLVSLTVKLHKKTVPFLVLLALFPFMVWRDYLGQIFPLPGAAQSAGLEQAKTLWHALHFRRLERQLNESVSGFPPEYGIDPEIARLIGAAPVASLSIAYTNLTAAHVRLELYPVIQRYAAFTPYLDGLNAAWIRDKGPRFLIFDGDSIDGRDPWAETPAMWLQVFRWYDTRLLSKDNLLLERRQAPRFGILESISRFHIPFPGELQLPPSTGPVFWAMTCPQSAVGKLQKLVFRIPEVDMTVHSTGAEDREARIIVPLLVSPVLVNLPGTLEQFADLFRTPTEPTWRVNKLRFDGPGSGSYASTCEVELLRPR